MAKHLQDQTMQKNPYVPRKNVQVHFRIDTGTYESLKRQAEKEYISFSETCRRRLRSQPLIETLAWQMIQLERKIDRVMNEIASGSLSIEKKKVTLVRDSIRYLYK